MLTRGQRGTNAIQVPGHLCNCAFQQFGRWGMFAHRRPRPLTRAFPDLMASQSHIGPNTSSRLVDIPVPTNEDSFCIRHAYPMNAICSASLEPQLRSEGYLKSAAWSRHFQPGRALLKPLASFQCFWTTSVKEPVPGKKY